MLTASLKDDLKLEFLDVFDVTMYAEEEFRIIDQVPNEHIVDFRTVGDIVHAVTSIVYSFSSNQPQSH